MPEITFVHPDGRRDVLDAADGDSVMEVATDAAIDGILGDCGGSAMCATCHVYVETARLESLPPMSIAEDGMLDTTASPRQPNSRLSCQIVVDDALDGASFEVPEEQ